MTRISQHKVEKEVLLKIYQLFFEVVSRSSGGKDEFLEMMDEILSPTEKVMIAKRVAIVYLIKKGIDQRNICAVLKVSSTTVSKFTYAFQKRNSKVVQNMESMIKNEAIANFLTNLVEDLFTQPGLRMGHWQKFHDQEKRRSRMKEYGV